MLTSKPPAPRLKPSASGANARLRRSRSRNNGRHPDASGLTHGWTFLFGNARTNPRRQRHRRGHRLVSAAPTRGRPFFPASPVFPREDGRFQPPSPSPHFSLPPLFRRRG